MRTSRTYRALKAAELKALSNAQCKQHNSADPDHQHRKRYWIIIEPVVSTLYAHCVMGGDING